MPIFLRERAMRILDERGPTDFNTGLRSLMRAEQNTWLIMGQELNRPSVKQFIVLLADGSFLPSICQMTGMPDLQTVIRWRKVDSEFDHELRVAEEAYAYRLMQDGMDILDRVDEPKMAFPAMNRAKFRQSLAAKLNSRFVEKTKTEDETPLQNRSEEQLREMLRMALESDPSLKTLVHAEQVQNAEIIGEVIPPEPTDEAGRE